jgi:hypothetical protein
MSLDEIENISDENLRNCAKNYFEIAYWKWAYQNMNELNMDKKEAGRRWKEAEMNLLINGAKFAGMSEQNCHMWNSTFWRSFDGLADSVAKKGVNLTGGVVFNWMGEHHVEVALTLAANPNFKLAETGLGVETSGIYAIMGSYIHTIKWEDEINFRIRLQGGYLQYSNSRIQKEDTEILNGFIPVTGAFNSLWTAFDEALSAGQEMDEATKNALCDGVYNAAMIFKNQFPDEEKLGDHCYDVMKWANDLKYRKTGNYRNDLDQLKSAYDLLASYISLEKSERLRSDAQFGVFSYNHMTGQSEGSIDELSPGGNLEWIKSGDSEMSTGIPFFTGAIELFGKIEIADHLDADYLISARPPPSLFVQAIGIREDNEMSTEEFVEGVKEGLPFLDSNMPTIDANIALSKKFLDPLFQKQMMVSFMSAWNLNHFSPTQIKGSVFYRPVDYYGNTYAPLTISASYGWQKPVSTGAGWNRSFFEGPKALDIQLTQALPMIMNGLTLNLNYTKQWYPIGEVNEANDKPVLNYGSSSDMIRATLRLDFDLLGKPEKLPPTPAHAWEPFPDHRINPNIQPSITAPKEKVEGPELDIQAPTERKDRSGSTQESKENSNSNYCSKNKHSSEQI